MFCCTAKWKCKCCGGSLERRKKYVSYKATNEYEFVQISHQTQFNNFYSYLMNWISFNYITRCDAMRSDGSNRIIFPLSLRHRLRITHYDCWIVFTFRRLFSYIFICYGIHFQCKMLFDTNSNKTIQNDVLLFSFLGVWFWYKIRFRRPHTFGHLN